MKITRVIGLLIVISACASSIAQKGEYNTIPKGGPFGESVSIIQILANPERYEGKHVRIIGYLHFEFEEEAIFLNKEDSDQMIDANAIWIHLPDDLSPELAAKLNKHYVHCEGVFSAKSHGHMGAYPGEISDVHWLSPSLSREELEKIVNGQQTKKR